MRDAIDVPTEKACSTCKKIKPSADFHSNRGAISGLMSQCKACITAYRSKHAEKVHQRNLANYKKNIEWNRRRAREWRERNIDKAKAKDKKRRMQNPHLSQFYYSRNPDKYRAYVHNRNARLTRIGGHFTDKDVAHMQHIQQGHCCYCGRIVPLTIEHIIPVTRDGTSNDPWNLALACGPCNSSKGDKLLEEWIAAGRWFDPPSNI